MAKNEALLKEIRENFTYATRMWQEIRDEAKTDMRYVAGDPWDPRERKAREGAGRPILSLDEINQYVNQVVNDARQNKRAIKVDPEGDGANDDTAEFQGNLIRQIEYDSQAQGAYLTAYESAVQRSYGAFRVSKCYCNPNGFDQKLKIERIPNPDSVLPDPDYKKADASDIRFCFVIDTVPRKQFKQRFPQAKTADFSPEITLNPDISPWFTDERVQIAEYWYIRETKHTLYLLDDGSPNGMTMRSDELPEGHKVHKNAIEMGGMTVPILRQRPVEDRKVYQCLTNGIEILEENEWEGEYIPIILCLGKELWMDDGSGAKRRLISLVRLARDPQMLYNYYRTCEAEIVGQVPKTPWVGYVGQFHNATDTWAVANKVPQAYLEVDGYPEGTYEYEPGKAPLPLPQRNAFEPPIQAMELGAESARQAIRAAMGISNLPTVAQRLNEKSGVALKEIASQQAQGAYHFVDSYDRCLEHGGRVMLDLIRKVYDTARDVSVRKADDSVEVAHINEPVTDPETGEISEYRTDCGNHAVTVTTGPSYDSQREKATEFATSLATPEMLGLALAGNQQAAKMVALAIRLQNGGALMDQIADIIDPNDPAGTPEEAQQALGILQQKLQEQALLIQELQQLADKNITDLKKAELDAQVKLKTSEDDNRTKLEIAKLNSKTKLTDRMMQEEGEDDRERLRASEDEKAREHQSEEADRDRQENRLTAKQE